MLRCRMMALISSPSAHEADASLGYRVEHSQKKVEKKMLNVKCMFYLQVSVS